MYLAGSHVLPIQDSGIQFIKRLSLTIPGSQQSSPAPLTLSPPYSMLNPLN